MAPADKAESKVEKPTHQVNQSPNANSDEVLLEPEVSRSERAAKMKKILQEVRKDFGRSQNQPAPKKSEAPASGNDSRTD